MNDPATILARIQDMSFARASAATRNSFPEDRRMDARALGAFLEHHPTGVLATTRPDGRPHAAPVTFTLAGAHIAIGSLEGAQRIENLQAHPHASLVVSSGEAAVAIIEGAARVVAPADAAPAVRERFRDPSGALPAWIGAFVLITPERILSYAAEGFEPGEPG